MLLVFAAAGTFAQHAPDSSFGVYGRVQLDIDAFDQARDLLAQPDGKFLLLFNTGHSTTNGFDQDAAVIRFDANGDPDPNFSSGLLRFDFANSGNSTLRKGVLQPDGKILLLGSRTASDTSAARPFFLRRVLADGTSDLSFGDSGEIELSFFGRTETPGGIVLQSDGKILVGGATSDSTHGMLPVLARLLPDGSPDTSFGGIGKLVVDFLNGILPVARNGNLPQPQHAFNGYFNDLLIDANGNILCAGAYAAGLNFQCLLMRFLPTGEIDSTFGLQGKIVNDLSPGVNNELHSLALQSGGAAIAGVNIAPGNANQDFGLFSISPQQQLAYFPFDLGHADKICDIVLDNDRPLCAGYSTLAANYTPFYTSDFFGLCRTDAACGAFDASFAGQGFTSFAFAQAQRSGAETVTLLADGRIILAGFTEPSQSGNLSDLALVCLQNAPQSIGETQTHFSFKLFPNPAGENVTIALEHIPENAELALLNSLGQEILREKINDRSLQLDARALSPGLYFVVIDSPAGQSLQKLSVR